MVSLEPSRLDFNTTFSILSYSNSSMHKSSHLTISCDPLTIHIPSSTYQLLCLAPCYSCLIFYYYLSTFHFTTLNIYRPHSSFSFSSLSLLYLFLKHIKFISYIHHHLLYKLLFFYNFTISLHDYHTYLMAYHMKC